MKKIIKPNHEYGEIIPDLTLYGQKAEYPVFNEREIRATAGIMFLIGISTMFITFFTKNFVLLQFVVPLFFIDFLIKVAVGPKYSPFGFIGSILVKNQEPDWVGAIQKRFSWMIGLGMSSTMILIVLLFQVRGIVPLSLCATCLTFMWMESSLGICVGCKMYAFLIDHKIISEPEVRPACPGGACCLRKN